MGEKRSKGFTEAEGRARHLLGLLRNELAISQMTAYIPVCIPF